MLRTFVGDSAFYKSLNLFLTSNKFKPAEAHQLRLAFEEVTGQDLNWYWNQWYFGSGHPALDISYDYDQNTKTAKVFVKQTQSDKVFKLPVEIDIYAGGGKKRHNVWVENKADTFFFPVSTQPDLINFDGNKILLCTKSDHKTLDNFVFQYKNAGLYMDRREAIDFAANKQTTNTKAAELIKTALNDKYDGLRVYSIQRVNFKNDSIKTAMAPGIIAEIAKNDP
jgi:aminopeptidase N